MQPNIRIAMLPADIFAVFACNRMCVEILLIDILE